MEFVGSGKSEKNPWRCRRSLKLLRRFMPSGSIRVSVATKVVIVVVVALYWSQSYDFEVLIPRKILACREEW